MLTLKSSATLGLVDIVLECYVWSIQFSKTYTKFTTCKLNHIQITLKAFIVQLKEISLILSEAISVLSHCIDMATDANFFLSKNRIQNRKRKL